MEAVACLETCAEPRSVIATTDPKCAWTSDEDGRYSCTFIEPNTDFKVILFVAIFSAILSTPIAILSHWLIKNILAAKETPVTLIDESAKVDKRKLLKPSTTPLFIDCFKRSSTVAVDEISQVDSSDNIQTDTFNTVKPSQQVTSSMKRSKNSNAVLLEMNSLCQDIQRYREHFTNTEEKAEFDAIWGLNTEGHFLAGERKDWNHNPINLCCGNRHPQVNITIMADLDRIQRTEKEELERMADICDEMPNEIGKRLLFLLQCDLMPGIQGKVLEVKSMRDFQKKKTVSLRKKQFVWAFLLLLNAGMLFYILLFALNQTKYRQDAWFQSFITWLFIEILVSSTQSVLITHVLIPSIAQGDVDKVKARLIETIRNYQHDIHSSTPKHSMQFAFDDETGMTTFNAAKYLFVSYRVAAKYPDLKESQIISRFSSPWPRQSYLKTHNVMSGYDKSTTAIINAFTVAAVVLLTSILNIPPSMQDLVIDIFATIVTGYMFLLHLQLWQLFPLLAFLPAVGIFVIVHFVLAAQKSVVKQKALKGHHKRTEHAQELESLRIEKEKQSSKHQSRHELCVDTEEQEIGIVSLFAAISTPHHHSHHSHHSHHGQSIRNQDNSHTPSVKENQHFSFSSSSSSSSSGSRESVGLEDNAGNSGSEEEEKVVEENGWKLESFYHQWSGDDSLLNGKIMVDSNHTQQQDTALPYDVVSLTKNDSTESHVAEQHRPLSASNANESTERDDPPLSLNNAAVQQRPHSANISTNTSQLDSYLSELQLRSYQRFSKKNGNVNSVSPPKVNTFMLPTEL